MGEEDVWEAAKTAVMLVGSLIFALLVLLVLDSRGMIEANIEIDPQVMTILFGAFLSAGLVSYLVNNMEWL